MLQIPLWKRVVIWGLVALGLAFAMPNLFYSRVEMHNDAVAEIDKLGSTPERVAAQGLWPDWLPSTIVNLGLDLRGGAHLLAEVQVEDVYESRMDGYWPEIRDALRDERAVVGTIRRQDSAPGTLRIRISNPDGMARALEVAREVARPVVSLTGVGASDIEVAADGADILVQLSDEEKLATDNRTIQQSLEIIRRRVDEVGTREPTIQRQGEDRILIQVPGIGSAEELKALIGTTAQLTFHPVVGPGDPAQNPGPRNILLPSLDEADTWYVLEQTPVVTGEELTDAQPAFDQNGQPSVNFRFNPTGARKFGQYTSENVGSPFAIVLDNEVISAPVIREAITGGSGQIIGRFSVEESTQLAVLLRAGALPAKMTFLEERTIGPELGQDSIEAGRIACLVAFAAVLVFMALSYGWFGIIANMALIINVGLIFGLLSMIGATLTLPGIAGIVLTIGMAVDANVLVFERIREEMKTAKGPARAIELGYEKALSRHPRRQHHHLHHRGDPVHHGLGPGARLLGDAGPWHPDLDLHGDLHHPPHYHHLVRAPPPENNRGLSYAPATGPRTNQFRFLLLRPLHLRRVLHRHGAVAGGLADGRAELRHRLPGRHNDPHGIDAKRRCRRLPAGDPAAGPGRRIDHRGVRPVLRGRQERRHDPHSGPGGPGKRHRRNRSGRRAGAAGGRSQPDLSGRRKRRSQGQRRADPVGDHCRSRRAASDHGLRLAAVRMAVRGGCRRSPVP